MQWKSKVSEFNEVILGRLILLDSPELEEEPHHEVRS